MPIYIRMILLARISTHTCSFCSLFPSKLYTLEQWRLKVLSSFSALCVATATFLAFPISLFLILKHKINPVGVLIANIWWAICWLAIFAYGIYRWHLGGVNDCVCILPYLFWAKFCGMKLEQYLLTLNLQLNKSFRHSHRNMCPSSQSTSGKGNKLGACFPRL